MENRSGAPNQPLRDSLALYDLALRSFLGPCLHCNRGPLSIEEAGRPGFSPEAEPGARQRSGTPATDQKPRRNACDPPVEQAGSHRGAGRECRSRSVRAPASSRSYGTQPASSTEIQGYSVITSRTAADGLQPAGITIKIKLGQGQNLFSIFALLRASRNQKNR